MLLDTHVWVWSHLEPDRLSRQAREALGSPSNEAWLSPISVWECLLLAERGRLELEGGAETWVGRALALGNVREAPLTSDIARASRRLKLPHQDPADRFILATAKVLGLTLVTSDRQLLKSGEAAILRASR